MFILKSVKFNEKELLEFARTHSSKKEAEINDQILFWDFGPVMKMKVSTSSNNYLFSEQNVPFHWDGAFYREPQKILFYCTQSKGEGGETLFADTEKIWDSLNPSEKEICEKITLNYKTQKLAHYGGEINVPLVQEHPVTKKKILRIAERVKTDLNPVDLEIKGVPKELGEKMYNLLVDKLYQEEFLYTHSWKKGDLLICDNFSYLHGRKALGNNKKRSFMRIQIL